MRPTRTLAAAALLLAAASADAQTTERLTLQGDAVAIYNLAGTVTIEAGTGSNVVVEVTRAGRDADELRLDRMDVSGRNALVIRYPDDDVIYPEGRGNTSFSVNSDGTFFRGEGGSGFSALIGMITGDGRVNIRRSGRGTEAHANLRILVPAGRSVDVRLGVGEVTATNVSGNLDIDVAAAHVQTSGTRGRLRVDTGSGRVRIADAEGDVLVDTGSGSVVLNGVRGESVEVDTGSGSVEGSGISANRFHVDTGSGSISMADVNARDIEFDTGSGSVTLSLVSQMDRLVIDTGSGGVRVAVPANLNASLEIDTGSGGINVDLPVNAVTRQRDRLVGTVGDGGPPIYIDTGSGGVRITRR